MKRITLIITTIILVVNLLFGFLLSSYKIYNVGFTSIIILLTGGFIFLLQSIKMKDAFAISLAFIFAVMGIIEFILAIRSPEQIRDNGYVITTIVMLVVQLIIILICNLSSNKIQ